jgi:hypothetical protein
VVTSLVLNCRLLYTWFTIYLSVHKTLKPRNYISSVLNNIVQVVNHMFKLFKQEFRVEMSP